MFNVPWSCVKSCSLKNPKYYEIRINFHLQLCERDKYCYNMSINSRRAQIGSPKYFRTNRYDTWTKPSITNNLPKFYLCLEEEVCKTTNFNK